MRKRETWDWIARNLLHLRLERGWTQEGLASLAGISRVGYRNIEKAKCLPRADTLRALAEVLGVTIQRLVQEPPAKLRVKWEIGPNLRKAAKDAAEGRK